MNGKTIRLLGALAWFIDEEVNAVEVGYCIGEDYWHMGIVAEAFREVISSSRKVNVTEYMQGMMSSTPIQKVMKKRTKI